MKPLREAIEEIFKSHESVCFFEGDYHNSRKANTKLILSEVLKRLPKKMNPLDSHIAVCVGRNDCIDEMRKAIGGGK